MNQEKNVKGKRTLIEIYLTKARIYQENMRGHEVIRYLRQITEIKKHGKIHGEMVHIESRHKSQSKVQNSIQN